MGMLRLCLTLHVRAELVHSFIRRMVWQELSPASASALLSTALSLVSLASLLLMCLIRKKRRMDGTYRPSAEERKQTRANCPEKPGLPLPLPKEERLI
uniref:Uncharacterized protein n=1 Tax=Knipowitschia caucasica TaxID=637954 RepID=A0AAV2LQ85_KNICA